MSFVSRFCNIVVLNQQQEQTNYYQNQCKNLCVCHSDYKKSVKNCTVVENGRVVVKHLELPTQPNQQEAVNKQQED